MYQLNYELLVERLIPTFLRKSPMVQWLRALVSPIAFTNSELEGLMVERLEALRYTSQTLALEARLEARFGAGISIQNNLVFRTFLVTPFAFGSSEPLISPAGFGYLSPICFPDALAQGTEDMFTVLIPAAYSAQETRIRAEVNRYKHAGYTFGIQYI